MILEANNQSINFLNFDTTFANKKLMLSLSGGTDSALLLYLFCLYKPDWDIICHTGIDKYKDPWLGEYASDIIHFMNKTFPNVNIIHEIYKFDSLDDRNLYYSKKEWDAQPDKSILPTPEGFSKAWTARPFKRKIRQKYKLKLSTHGISHNPPVDVQKEMGFRNTVETLRDKKYDELKPGTNGNIHYMPFINIDKKFIAGLYEQFNLIDTLFLSTMSCIGFKKETKNFTEPCRKCFWCYEKKWAFGCYDGGQK
jgi:hypothetical protein